MTGINLTATRALIPALDRAMKAREDAARCVQESREFADIWTEDDLEARRWHDPRLDQGLNQEAAQRALERFRSIQNTPSYAIEPNAMFGRFLP